MRRNPLLEKATYNEDAGKRNRFDLIAIAAVIIFTTTVIANHLQSFF